MTSIERCELPPAALLRRYEDGQGYTDCYCVDVPGAHPQAAYVEAFYTTPLFKVERAILRLIARPSTDEDARQLAAGWAAHFAAWTVEAQRTDQLLLGDFSGRTKSWLMTAPTPGVAGSGTRLYFGSAVVPRPVGRGGRLGMGLGFRALLRFHKLYSRLLLAAAGAKLTRSVTCGKR